MSNATCPHEQCTRRVRMRGMCGTHYERWRRYGDPLAVSRPEPLDVRVWRNVDATGDCWIWTGGGNSHGYGQIREHGRHRMAHRVVWELLVGPIPVGLELDHLCRNPPCVNPDHLEPVTHRENMRRAPRTAVHTQREKTHCPRDHEYTPENTYINPKGSRACRVCRLARQRASRASARIAA